MVHWKGEKGVICLFEYYNNTRIIPVFSRMKTESTILSLNGVTTGQKSAQDIYDRSYQI